MPLAESKSFSASVLGLFLAPSCLVPRTCRALCDCRRRDAHGFGLGLASVRDCPRSVVVRLEGKDDWALAELARALARRPAGQDRSISHGGTSSPAHPETDIECLAPPRVLHRPHSSDGSEARPRLTHRACAATCIVSRPCAPFLAPALARVCLRSPSRRPWSRSQLFKCHSRGASAQAASWTVRNPNLPSMSVVGSWEV